MRFQKNARRVAADLLLGRKGILASLSGVHRELSWLLSVVSDTESDMRDGDEQLLLFWLLLATVSSSSESTSLLSSVRSKQPHAVTHPAFSFAGSELLKMRSEDPQIRMWRCSK